MAKKSLVVATRRCLELNAGNLTRMFCMHGYLFLGSERCMSCLYVNGRDLTFHFVSKFVENGLKESLAAKPRRLYLRH